MSTAPQIVELTPDAAGAAAQLWRDTGLVRPWNDPEADFLRAVSMHCSAVMGAVLPGASPLEPGELVGTAMVGVDGHRGWLYYVAVAPELQGTGVGRDLVRAAEAWLRDAGAPKVQLMVRETNARVMGFYEALGYTDQDTRVLGRFLDPELERLRREG